MTAALLSPSPMGDASGGTKKATASRSESALRTRPDDRWQTSGAPARRFSTAMALVLFGSLVLHAIIVGTAFFGGTPVVAPEQEISVEIVQEPPKPPPPAAKAQPAKDAAAKPPAELRKAEAPEPPKPEAKAEPPKPEPPKAEPLKAEPPKAEPPKPEAAKAEDSPKPEPPRAAESPKPDPDDKRIETMQHELAALQAERDALETQKLAAKAALARQDTDLGPLPDSFQAVALPATADGADEAVGYQGLVFSQLAKAKGIGQRQGVPGSAGVRFEIDEKGQLVSAEIVAPSGDAGLDAEALAIVHKAAPFPVPPQGAQRSFVANVNFTPAATPSAP